MVEDAGGHGEGDARGAGGLGGVRSCCTGLVATMLAQVVAVGSCWGLGGEGGAGDDGKSEDGGTVIKWSGTAGDERCGGDGARLW